ncbi:MAG: phosphatase PAP2 family protein [Candidatus Heimdallarchaeota archaeon]
MEREDKLLIFKISLTVISLILIVLILLIPSLFEFSWNELLRNLLPNTEYFFRYITELGGTILYLVLFFVIFWGINKTVAKYLLIVYITSNIVNFYAKAIIANERPPESNWILIGASHLSTPSGHAMSSTVVWGYTSMKFKNIMMWVISILIIILVGLSRIYLGVHWFGDVLTGWLFGIAILSLVWILEEPIRDFISRHKIPIFYLILIIIGLILMILTEVFYDSEYNFGTVGGQLIGFGIGFALEERYVNFNINYEPGNKWKLILRILIGIVFVVIVYFVMYLLIDSDVFWINSIHYIITLVIGIFIWPLIFKKLGF